MEDGVAKNLPIFGVIYKLRKAVLGIREQYFIKKIYHFLIEIKDITVQERKNFIKDLDDPKFDQRAGETLLLLLEKFQKF